VVGLSGGCVGGIVSSIGVITLLLLSRNPIGIWWENGWVFGPFGPVVFWRVGRDPDFGGCRRTRRAVGPAISSQGMNSLFARSPGT